jgi:hypothetical protein
VKRDLGEEIWKYAAGATREVFPAVIGSMTTVVGEVTESPASVSFTETVAAFTGPGSTRQLTKRPVVAGSLRLTRTSDGFLWVEGTNYSFNATTGVITNINATANQGLTASYYYYSTSGGATGPIGPNGTPGTVWRIGIGPPAGTLGIPGDLYSDTNNGDVYEKTGASTYTLRANLTGPVGPQGIPGPEFPGSATLSASGPIPTDKHVIKINADAADVTGTLPTAVGRVGKAYAIKNISTSLVRKVTVMPTGTETIEGRPYLDTETPGDCVWLESDGANWTIVSPPTYVAV